MTCETCNGTGGIGHYENGAPFGGGNWPMWIADSCPNCVEKGICPRCDKEMFLDKNKVCYVCHNCGYDESKGQ